MGAVLVSEDDADLRGSLAAVLTAKGYDVQQASSAERTLATLATEAIEVILLDLHLEDVSGLDLLEKIRALEPELPVVVLTGEIGIPTAVNAMKLGAFDYLTKPCRNEEVALVIERALKERSLRREVEVLRERLTRGSEEPDVLWKGPAMQRLLEQVERAAPTDLTVILQGESGTGKELIARRLHVLSSRRRESFVAVDCGALPDSLVESELFGHEKGSFTGAHQKKLGQFELALRGTLFLDEIGNLPYGTQAKLLRAIQERRIRRVGGTKDIPIDVRLIAASNVDLGEAVRAGKFRDDLYHRLNQFTLYLPPLRERPEDIPLLADHFLREANRLLKKEVRGFSPEAAAAVQAYPWPGNVRELKNTVTRAVLLSDELVEPRHLNINAPSAPVPSPQPGAVAADGVPAASRPDSDLALRKVASGAVAAAELEMIRSALTQVAGNKVRAAKALGISRMTLYLKMKKYGIPL